MCVMAQKDVHKVLALFPLGYADFSQDKSEWHHDPSSIDDLDVG